MVDRGWVHVPVVVMFIRNGDDDGRESFEFVTLRSSRMESQAFRWEESELPSLGRGGYDWDGEHPAKMRRYSRGRKICVFQAWCANNSVE